MIHCESSREVGRRDGWPAVGVGDGWRCQLLLLVGGRFDQDLRLFRQWKVLPLLTGEARLTPSAASATPSWPVWRWREGIATVRFVLENAACGRRCGEANLDGRYAGTSGIYCSIEHRFKAINAPLERPFPPGVADTKPTDWSIAPATSAGVSGLEKAQKAASPGHVEGKDCPQLVHAVVNNQIGNFADNY